MKKLFAAADQYIQESNWKTLAAVKFCLFSMGVFAGSCLSAKAKTPVRILCSIVFGVTYLPLMAKFFQIAARLSKEGQDGSEDVG